MEGVTDKQDANCFAIIDRDDLEHVEGDDSDKHHREDQERPGGGERLEIMGFIEPDHEHGEADEEGDGEVDPEEDINERGVNKTIRNGCLVISGGPILNGL